MIPSEKDEPTLAGQRSHAAKDKTDPFLSERVRPRQIPENLSMQRPCEPDLDLHFSFETCQMGHRICAQRRRQQGDHP